MATKQETNLNRIMNMFIHAAADDQRKVWNGDAKYPEAAYHTYATMSAEKPSKTIKTIVSITSEVRQILSKLLNVVAEEIVGAKLDDITGSIGSLALAERLRRASSMSAAATLFEIGEAKWALIEKNAQILKGAIDPTNYIFAALSTELSKVKANSSLIASVELAFSRFLKAYAYHIVCYLWFKEQSFSKDDILGYLRENGMNQDILDEVAACLREKKTKPKATTTAPAAPMVDINSNSQPTPPASNEALSEEMKKAIADA